MIIKVQNIEKEKLDKLQEILKDESFAESIAEASPEEAQKAFESKGVSFTLEQVEELGKAINDASNPSDELSENDLENVAGGGTFTLVDIEWKTKKGTKITIHIPW